MLNILIVDDETIVRTSLASMMDWGKEGFCISSTASNGKAALQILRTQPIDVLFTDIKMPIMDGIELIKKLQDFKNPPLVIVLSAYSEFDLVRKAFRYGAHDYILKSDITPAYIREILCSLRPLFKPAGAKPMNQQVCSKENILRSMALGNMEKAHLILPNQFCLACIEIDHFKKESLRFGRELDSALIQPLLEFAVQVPRVSAKCVITPISYSRFLLLFLSADAMKQADSICMQVQKVWKDYMNLSVTVGISDIGHDTDDFYTLLQECCDNITLKYIFGAGGIYTPTENQIFDVKKALMHKDELLPLLEGIRSMNAQLLIDSQQGFMIKLYQGTLDEAKTMALEIVYNLQLQLLDAGADLWNVFNTDYETDFYQQVSMLDDIRDVEMWIIGVIRWVTQYLSKTQVSAEMDLMEKAKRFIADHCTEPELNLAVVAGYIGLNEKYFSTRFNRETGKSFVQYLTELRISRAKQLILKTDMRVYEVSDAVGFSSVEHFTRVFKKYAGVSPKSYHGDNI